MLTKLEDRVAKLEGEMDEVRHDVSDALAIRTELRAHIKTLEALRETQLEMGAKADRMDEKMDREFAAVRGEMHDGLAAVRSEMHDGLAAVRGEMHDGFAAVRSEMREVFTKLNLGMAQITALLNIAIGREGLPD
jgi:DNA anti-recombination protein RmuC